jgi:hypothetical protein
MRRVVLVLATMALAILLASGVAQAIINGEPDRGPRACYELGRKPHRNADYTVGLVPSRSLFPAFLSCF